MDRMIDDERAIRELVATWMEASRAGDVGTVLDLTTDDVVFMVPGREPFGKEAFAAARSMTDMRLDGTSDIRELRVLGDWGWLRNYIEVTMTPPGGAEPLRRAGYTLTILRKQPDGRWVLMCDANLLAEAAVRSIIRQDISLRASSFNVHSGSLLVSQSARAASSQSGAGSTIIAKSRRRGKIAPRDRAQAASVASRRRGQQRP